MLATHLQLQYDFWLEFPKLLSQPKPYLLTSMHGNSKIIHCGILPDMFNPVQNPTMQEY